MSQAVSKILNRIDNEIVRFAPFAVLVVDDQQIVQVANAKAQQILAVPAGEHPVPHSDPHADPFVLVGHRITDTFPNLDLSTVGFDDLASLTTNERTPALELQCIKVVQDGREWTIVYVNPTGPQRQRERLLEKEACTDPLSGLANRRAFQRAMENNQHRKLSLAIVDIDRFKTINDLHGHVIGDDVIQSISRELRLAFEESAVLVSRMGGDEFGILFETEDSDLILESLDGFHKRVAAAELQNSPDVKFSVSIGVAISKRTSIGSRMLLTQADRKLYSAKEKGRNQIAHLFLDEPENETNNPNAN